MRLSNISLHVILTYGNHELQPNINELVRLGASVRRLTGGVTRIELSRVKHVRLF